MIRLDLLLTPTQAGAYRAVLTRQPELLLKRIGVLLVAQAKRAFVLQRFGAILWPERYPNQTGGKLNVAGAVSDLANGPTIKARRWDARPAGRDTGELMRRLTYRVIGDRLEVGSDVPYAQKFHAGGESVLPITQAVRANLAIWLRRHRKRVRKAARLAGTLGPRGGTPRTFEDRVLGPLFARDVLITSSPARPFVGLTDETEREIVAELRRLAEERRP